MSKEEKKIAELTVKNTIENRNVNEQKDKYIKKVKKEYESIYGKEGESFLKRIRQRNTEGGHGKNSVTFSNVIKYSID